MRYAKLINNYPSYAPNPIRIGDNWIGNPPGTVYKEEGYLPVTIEVYPSEDPEDGYYWSLVWTEDAEGIYGTWQQIPIEDTE